VTELTAEGRGTPAPASKWPEARELAERLVSDAGSSVRAVLLYGSRLLKTRPDRHSALDFVVIVDDYRSFYEHVVRAGELDRPISVMTGLSRVLAPNVIAYAPDDGREGLAKCLVVSKADFAAALGPNPPDHFVLGRMLQRVGEVWAADAIESVWVHEQVGGAHMRVLDWMEPYLEEEVDAAGLGRRILEVCYQGELRPESRGRAGAIFEAQAAHFKAALEPALRAAVADGRMIEREGRYALASPVQPRVVRRWRRHFRRSKLRSTARWFKHTVTFANWLPYVVRKVERHTGRSIELTTLERKAPLLFLWPRAIYVLLTRPRREIRS
jgi:hypothetical protein